MDAPLAGAVLLLWVAAWCALTCVAGGVLDLPVLYRPAAAVLLLLGAGCVVVGGFALAVVLAWF